MVAVSNRSGHSCGMCSSCGIYSGSDCSSCSGLCGGTSKTECTDTIRIRCHICFHISSVVVIVPSSLPPYPYNSSSSGEGGSSMVDMRGWY